MNDPMVLFFLCVILLALLLLFFVLPGKLKGRSEPQDQPLPLPLLLPTPESWNTLNLSMLPAQFVVLDLETTGLSPEGDEIIEVGAIRVNRDSDNHDGFQAFVRSEKDVPRRITEITGITQHMIDGEGKELAVVLADFAEFIGDLPLVTFNAAFDMDFLHHAANKQGIKIKNR